MTFGEAMQERHPAGYTHASVYISSCQDIGPKTASRMSAGSYAHRGGVAATSAADSPPFRCGCALSASLILVQRDGSR